MNPGYVLDFAVTVFLCFVLVRRGSGILVDEPGERSLHSAPVPRSGGIAICVGMAVGAWLTSPQWQAVFDPLLLVGMLLLWLVSVLDDMKSLGQIPRLLCQLVAALLAVFAADLYFRMGVLAWIWPLAGVFAILWGINLYNFMDGMDGFAAGMAVIGFLTLAVFSIRADDPALAGLCLLVVSAQSGFLLFNFPPARMFMGDSGSTVTGFLMVTLSLLGWRRGIYPAWIPLVIFSPFWVDATVTLIRRVLRGRKIWQAHREHYYQRWVLAGFGHRRVVLAEYGLMVACSVSVLAWQAAGAGYNESMVPVGWLVVYAVLVGLSDRVLAKLPVT